MKVPLYQFDSFTSRRFAGNPAAVCTLADWMDDETLQNIAAENNLSETAFIVLSADGYHIRWFTPEAEVPLCGHATLAAAAVVLRELEPDRETVVFASASGPLTVNRDAERLVMDFPAASLKRLPSPRFLTRGLGAEPAEAWVADYYMAVFPAQTDIETLAPDYREIATLDRIGVIVTAPGADVDFVSRFFAPQLGIPEDPVTGSAHCMLTPYWSGRLGRTELAARQLSKRGGELLVAHRGDRVFISGCAVKYLEGTIEI